MVSTTMSPEQVLGRLERTTDQIVGRKDLLARLGEGRPLRIKFGVDCTAPDLHLGHAVNLWMMRYLQDCGHTVIFLLGDQTTRIGDPTGRTSSRPVLGAEEIERNAQEFLRQVRLVLRDDPGLLEVRRNSEWYASMSINDLLAELSGVTYRQLMSRDMFRTRIEQRQEIAMHELIYPVLQGFDSVALESDLTIVGSDQLFNETIGRQLQLKHGQRPQTVITSMITPGLDGGPKQSKSLNNYVGLAQPAAEQFGRLMTLRDELIGRWATVYTELPASAVADLCRRAAAGGRDARDAKADLAEAIVARYHGPRAAARARADFVTIFSERSAPDDVAELIMEDDQPTVLDLVRRARPDLTGSAARRLIVEGGVRLGDAVLDDPRAAATVRAGALLRVGRRRWFRIAGIDSATRVPGRPVARR